jgi:hypothetical protein
MVGIMSDQMDALKTLYEARDRIWSLSQDLFVVRPLPSNPEAQRKELERQ